MTPLLFILVPVSTSIILLRYRFVLVGLIVGYLIVLPITAGSPFSTTPMDSTPESFCRSSAMVTPFSEENPSIEASSAYSSPVSAITPHGPGYPPAGLAGLGISGLDDLGSFPNAVPYSVSPIISNQLTPLDNLYSIPLEIDDYTNAPFFPAYDGVSAAPHSPLSTYGSQAMSASPSYNSSLEVSSGQNAQNIFPAQVPGYWASASCMGSTCPLEPVSTVENSSQGGHWDQAYYPEASITVNPSTLPVATTSYPPMKIASEGIHTSLEQIPALNQAVNSSRSTMSDDSAARGSLLKAPKRRTSPKRQLQKDKDKGYACRHCGYVFTRRSNCMEHQKKHDPRSRESHPCAECDKTFGRKADLKRHTNNVSIHSRQGKKVADDSDSSRLTKTHMQLVPASL